MNNQIRDFKLFISLCLAMLLIIAFNVSAEPVSLNNTPVRAFVQWYSQKANKSVVVNPDVKGNITVFNADVNQANIDDFFKSVLNSNGFVLSAGNPAVVTTPTNFRRRLIIMMITRIRQLMIRLVLLPQRLNRLLLFLSI
ncbi:hypothetical protein [Kosakonia oryzendophytica]|uniref:hypothetical protein n=1 Tax=Kosakonia oryzendophytica TaxID=1005665 RepID=UPI0022EC748A|nr:hypothetical protein [Kosakonia oryzendophytica]WBT56085.1 hypothetical protein O9K67_12815 [Kosakonia oryzendophytica]